MSNYFDNRLTTSELSDGKLLPVENCPKCKLCKHTKKLVKEILFARDNSVKIICGKDNIDDFNVVDLHIYCETCGKEVHLNCNGSGYYYHDY